MEINFDERGLLLYAEREAAFSRVALNRFCRLLSISFYHRVRPKSHRRRNLRKRPREQRGWEWVLRVVYCKWTVARALSQRRSSARYTYIHLLFEYQRVSKKASEPQKEELCMWQSYFGHHQKHEVPSFTYKEKRKSAQSFCCVGKKLPSVPWEHKSRVCST